MVTQKDINEYLNKNVSYLFTISCWENSLYINGVLRPYIVNTYLYYNNNNEYINILLKKECIDDLYYCIDYKGKDRRYKLPCYHNHEEYGNIVLLQIHRNPFLKDEDLYHLESNNYSLLKDTYLYKDNLITLLNTQFDLHKRVIEEDEVLNGLLEIKFKCKVKHYWTSFDKEKETLTLEKIKNMNTDLRIKKDWIISKIDNATHDAKLAYQEVLQHATEITIPSVIALGKQETIDYEKIYNSVKEALIKKCGKPQYQIEIHGTKYPLMCSYVDFKTKLSKVITKYKLKDLDKLTNILIDHVNKLKSPLLKYYIEKDNTSNLAGDYECYVESKEVNKPQSFEI